MDAVNAAYVRRKNKENLFLLVVAIIVLILAG